MTTAELEDRVLIRDRYGAYSDSVFQQNCDAWLSCWSENGIWVVFAKEIRGKEALRKQWTDTWQTIDKMTFFSEIGTIKLADSKADVRSYCHETVLFKDGKLLKVISQYSDQLVKENGHWLFFKRDYSVLIRE